MMFLFSGPGCEMSPSYIFTWIQRPSLLLNYLRGWLPSFQSQDLAHIVDIKFSPRPNSKEHHVVQYDVRSSSDLQVCPFPIPHLCLSACITLPFPLRCSSSYFKQVLLLLVRRHMSNLRGISAYTRHKVCWVE